MKKLLSKASTEEVLQDVAYWEDPDEFVMMLPTEYGEVYVQDYDGSNGCVGKTVKDALIKRQINHWKDWHSKNKESIRKEAKREMKLDWSEAIAKI